MILKTGVLLLVISSTGVIVRSADLDGSSIPCLEWLCLVGLGLSLLCFAAVYVLSDMSRLQKTFTRILHMLKSLPWGPHLLSRTREAEPS